MARAYFGPPRSGPGEGGLQVTVHLVPVFQGQLVVFDVTLAQARGRWLPWDVIDYGANPYEAASALADDWCDGALEDLVLVDVLSLSLPGSGWELAIVFRAELTAKPEGNRSRIPALVAQGQVDAFGVFDPVDIERWMAAAPGHAEVKASPSAPRPGLLF